MTLQSSGEIGRGNAPKMRYFRGPSVVPKLMTDWLVTKIVVQLTDAGAPAAANTLHNAAL
jgi:hypothetical protein